MGDGMKYKTFGRSDEKVSLLGYGAWGIGKTMWIGAEDEESKKSLHRAIESGVTLFDSALVYGNGHSEKLIGEVEKASGKQLFITSKIPPKNFQWPARETTQLEEAFPSDHIVSSTERSLRNLNRDYIDLQQFHVWNDNWAEQDEWQKAVEKLKKEGKVRYFGISINDHQPENGIRAGRTGLIDCYQVIFNIFDQSPTDKLFDFCSENAISILARVPLDEGGLTGNITPDIEFPPRDWRNNYFRGDRKKQVADRVDAIWNDIRDAVESMPEAALRYVISFPAVTSVIPGMRTEKHLRSNVQYIGKGALSQEKLELLKKHRWVRNFY
jgi:aryl-alcohol dehydrogenase-like predicted oxidoreductase